MSVQDDASIIRFAIKATNTNDAYSVGFRNGLKYALFVLTGEEPRFDKVGEKTNEDTEWF